MWVILTYDVGVKRNSRIRKVCRKYLIHVQKSVFEGDITESKLSKLKGELSKIINPDMDQVAIYRTEGLRSFGKDVIGYQMTQDNIL